jgi:hypothetical protein
MVKLCVGSMKNHLATNAESAVESNDGPRPPYQAAPTTAGKKNMKGRALVPITGPSAARAIPARTTHPTATAYFHIVDERDVNRG